MLGNCCHALHLVEVFGDHKSWPKDDSRKEKGKMCQGNAPKENEY